MINSNGNNNHTRNVISLITTFLFVVYVMDFFWLNIRAKFKSISFPIPFEMKSSKRNEKIFLTIFSKRLSATHPRNWQKDFSKKEPNTNSIQNLSINFRAKNNCQQVNVNVNANELLISQWMNQWMLMWINVYLYI